MIGNEILRLDNISFSYGDKEVIKDFSLSVCKGTFTTLLGPSGCGKTTLLRIIAGFLSPESGSVSILGKDVTKVSVEERKIGYVFQDYALFPHMTVKQNLLFGFSTKERKNHLADLAEVSRSLGIENFLDRYPYELSGGQQQRVALGRTLMLKPEIILMDEPLSSLDAKLRIHVRQELIELQKQIGITTIYVTHDQEEALSLSSNIAVIDKGKLLQYDTPKNIYFKPENRKAAELSGNTNYVKKGEDLVLVRPEWFSFCEVENPDAEFISGKIISSSFLGAVTRYKIQSEKSENGVLIVDAFDSVERNDGDEVFLRINNFCGSCFI